MGGQVLASQPGKIQAVGRGPVSCQSCVGEQCQGCINVSITFVLRRKSLIISVGRSIDQSDPGPVVECTTRTGHYAYIALKNNLIISNNAVDRNPAGTIIS